MRPVVKQRADSFLRYHEAFLNAAVDDAWEKYSTPEEQQPEKRVSARIKSIGTAWIEIRRSTPGDGFFSG
jgi:uncharacterized protein (DUF736 family)